MFVCLICYSWISFEIRSVEVELGSESECSVMLRDECTTESESTPWKYGAIHWSDNRYCIEQKIKDLICIEHSK